MTNSIDYRDLKSQHGRDRAFEAAVGAGEWGIAKRVASMWAPRGATGLELQVWGVRRRLLQDHPFGIDTFSICDLKSQTGRNRAFVALAAQGRWERALEVAQIPVPAEATERERREWGARSDACRAAILPRLPQEAA